MKHILLFVASVSVLYLLAFFSLYSVKYKEKPAVFVTNDYYSWKGGSTYAKYAEFDENKSYDVIFLGSSRAYRGYSPYVLRDHGFSSFNLGTPAQSAKNSYFIAKHYLNKSNCKLLLLDVYALNYVDDELESSSDMIQNVGKSEAAVDIALHNWDPRVINMLALRLFTKKDSTYYASEDYLGLGYSRRDNKITREQIKRSLAATVVREPYQVSSEQLRYLDKLLELVKGKDIKVVVAYSPVSILYKHYVHEPFIARIQPILKRHGVPFLDYSQCDSITTSQHFYDMSHLNQQGVEIFNRKLFKDLISEKLIN